MMIYMFHHIFSKVALGNTEHFLEPLSWSLLEICITLTEQKNFNEQLYESSNGNHLVQGILAGSQTSNR